MIGHLQLVAGGRDDEAEVKSVAVREDRQGAELLDSFGVCTDDLGQYRAARQRPTLALVDGSRTVGASAT